MVQTDLDAVLAEVMQIVERCIVALPDWSGSKGGGVTLAARRAAPPTFRAAEARPEAALAIAAAQGFRHRPASVGLQIDLRCTPGAAQPFPYLLQGGMPILGGQLQGRAGAGWRALPMPLLPVCVLPPLPPPVGHGQPPLETRTLACQRCHASKVACRVSVGQACSRCLRLGIPCVPSTRRGGAQRGSKRKRAGPLLVAETADNGPPTDSVGLVEEIEIEIEVGPLLARVEEDTPLQANAARASFRPMLATAQQDEAQQQAEQAQQQAQQQQQQQQQQR